MKNSTPVLGLTATANKDMRDLSIKYLGMQSNLKPIVVSPNKDNIRFTVLKADKSMHCFDWLVELLKEKKENTPFTIIFCKTVNYIVSVLTFFLMKLGQSGLYIDRECSKHERCLLGVFYSRTPQNTKTVLPVLLKLYNSVWELTSTMFSMLCTMGLPRTSQVIYRKQDVLDELEGRLST